MEQNLFGYYCMRSFLTIDNANICNALMGVAPSLSFRFREGITPNCAMCFTFLLHVNAVMCVRHNSRDDVYNWCGCNQCGSCCCLSFDRRIKGIQLSQYSLSCLLCLVSLNY